MLLYVGNPSAKIVRFNYPVIGRRGSFFVEIQPGKQVKLPFNFQREEVDEVIRVARKFGALSAQETGGKLQNKAGLVYRIDKPISEHDLTDTFESNEQLAIDEAAAEVQNAAAAALIGAEDKTGGDADVEIGITAGDKQPKNMRDTTKTFATAKQ